MTDEGRVALTRMAWSRNSPPVMPAWGKPASRGVLRCRNGLDPGLRRDDGWRSVQRGRVRHVDGLSERTRTGAAGGMHPAHPGDRFFSRGAEMSNEQHRYDAGTESGQPAGANPASAEGRTTRVVTLVCELCGKDYSYEDDAPPRGL